MNDPFNLARFLDAQANVYASALTELHAGAKRSHWMWYIFPQLAGLGSSSLSRHYAIGSHAEAEAYWAHPVLGPRLRECAQALLTHHNRTAREILGTPDDLKLRSSATLFSEVTGETVFAQLLEQFFGGRREEETVRLMRNVSK